MFSGSCSETNPPCPRGHCKLDFPTIGHTGAPAFPVPLVPASLNISPGPKFASSRHSGTRISSTGWSSIPLGAAPRCSCMKSKKPTPVNSTSALGFIVSTACRARRYVSSSPVPTAHSGVGISAIIRSEGLTGSASRRCRSESRSCRIRTSRARIRYVVNSSCATRRS